MVRGMDIAGLAIQQLDRQSRRLVETDMAQPPGQIAAAIDAVLALDVIEHLDDDRVAHARLGTLMSPGGAQMVWVPTLPALSTDFAAIWVIADATYRKLCARLFSDSGLLLEQIFWWERWLVPALLRHCARRRWRPGQAPSEIHCQ